MKVDIQQLLETAVHTLQEQSELPAELQYSIQVTETSDPAHGDLATNLALMLSKQAGIPPQQLAELIIAELPDSGIVEKTEIAGPGFINFFLSSDSVAASLELMLASDRLGVAKTEPAQTVVIDYSSPNLAKEMHVGHLRSTVIGDAVVRTLEFLGHKVVRQNHVGDWGTQFGMLLAYLEERQQAGEQTSMVLADLEGFYRTAKKCFDESEGFSNRARGIVVQLQSGEKKYLQEWQQFIDVSLSHCQQVYDRLGVTLQPEDVHAESAFNADLPNIIADLDKAGMLTEDQGAKCVFMDEFKGRDDQPLPVIVQKRDGGYLYASTDLAAMRYRYGQLKADRILYFVDARQGEHFKQVFAVAKKAGFVPESLSLEHMGFGTVNGKDGKPFKTRAGNSIKLSGLLDEAQSRAYKLVKQKNPDEAEAYLKGIADVVGIAAVKYADLAKNRNSNYIFDWDQMLSFEGNTAPYLMYAYTRIASIFRRGDINVDKLGGNIILAAPKEIELANHIITFAEVLEKVGERGMPHLLAAWLYDLAVIFSSFYESCPVLNADDDKTRQSRLRLSLLTAQVLQKGLQLLGIKTLEKM